MTHKHEEMKPLTEKEMKDLMTQDIKNLAEKHFNHSMFLINLSCNNGRQLEKLKTDKEPPYDYMEVCKHYLIEDIRRPVESYNIMLYKILQHRK